MKWNECRAGNILTYKNTGGLYLFLDTRRAQDLLMNGIFTAYLDAGEREISEDTWLISFIPMELT